MSARTWPHPCPGLCPSSDEGRSDGVSQGGNAPRVATAWPVMCCALSIRGKAQLLLRFDNALHTCVSPVHRAEREENPYLVLTTHAKFHGSDQTGYDPYPEAFLVWDVICQEAGMGNSNASFSHGAKLKLPSPAKGTNACRYADRLLKGDVGWHAG